MTTEQRRLFYGAAIAAAGIGVTLFATNLAPPAWAPTWQLAAFIAATLLAVQFGFPLSSYSSLDRIPQVASILVLGPIQAAWVSVAASFVFPIINRNYNGGHYGFGFARGLHNAGMLSLTLLGGGIVYVYAGGDVPLEALTLRDAVAVVLMALVMQAINAAMVALRARAERGDMSEAALSYSDLLDLAIVPVGVLAAIMLNRLDAPTIALFVVLMIAFTLLVNRLARSRRELQLRNTQLEQAAAKDRLFLDLQSRAHELQRQSSEDPLTGLANRRRLDAYLDSEVTRALEIATPLSLAIADVDHFKHINDAHGHAVGDEVLRATANLLQVHCQKDGLAARYGGEEFAVALPHTSLDAARQRCEQVREAFAAFDWTRIAPGLNVTISIGVADLAGCGSASRLFEVADANLYRAKREGRNRVVG